MSNMRLAFNIVASALIGAGISFLCALHYTPQLFHVQFYHDEDTWARNHWFGIRTQQNPNDAWITQEIIWEVKPDYIIEAGSANGGGALFWATVLEQVNPNGKVISIDIEDNMGEARKLPIAQRMVEYVISSSTEPALIRKLSERTAGKKVLVILDSDHRKPHVFNELTAYASMVSKGSYMIVQDSNVNGNPAQWDLGEGPMEAIVEFMKGTKDFVIDSTRERLILTFCPKGYLKRV